MEEEQHADGKELKVASVRVHSRSPHAPIDWAVLKVPTTPILDADLALLIARPTAWSSTTMDITWLPLTRAPAGESSSTVGTPSADFASPPLVSLIMPWLLSRSCAHIIASRIVCASESLSARETRKGVMKACWMCWQSDIMEQYKDASRGLESQVCTHSRLPEHRCKEASRPLRWKPSPHWRQLVTAAAAALCQRRTTSRSSRCGSPGPVAESHGRPLGALISSFVSLRSCETGRGSGRSKRGTAVRDPVRLAETAEPTALLFLLLCYFCLLLLLLLLHVHPLTPPPTRALLGCYELS